MPSGPINFAPSLIAPDFRVVTTRITLGSGVVGVVARASPNRVALHFWASVTDDWQIAITEVPVSQFGDISSRLHSPLEYTFANVGPLVTMEFSGTQTSGGTTSIYVSEVIYEPKVE